MNYSYERRVNNSPMYAMHKVSDIDEKIKVA